jgi:hypothetical protein
MSNDDQGYRRQQDQAPVFAVPARLLWSLYSFWLNFRIHKGGLAAHRRILTGIDVPQGCSFRHEGIEGVTTPNVKIVR